MATATENWFEVTSKGNVRIPVEVPTEHCTHMEISIYYTKGGANYFSGKVDPRGINVSVTPIALKDGCVSMLLGHGLRKFVKEMARKNDKALENERRMMMIQVKGRAGELWDMLLKVCATEKVTLKIPA